MEHKLRELEKKIGVPFQNINTLKKALLHRSYVIENNFEKESNERLEFLGDAVLELAVSKFLFNEFPEMDEGQMTNLRAMLVNTKRLAAIAKEMEIPEYILLSKGELKTSGKEKESILADALEAVIGAIYYDRGYEAAEKFIKQKLLIKINEVIAEQKNANPKGQFQEIAQEKTGITPTYKVLKEWGPDHDKNFVVGLYLDQELIAKGSGKSKQEAESVAASKALKNKKWH
ncbi:MAG: ribonuclease III [candidate division WOR-3 bacterium]